jgi:hypothetical protein
MYDISHPLASSCFVKNDCIMRAKATKPAIVVNNVYKDHAHGLRNSNRHWRCSLPVMLPGVKSCAEGPASGCALLLAICDGGAVNYGGVVGVRSAGR